MTIQMKDADVVILCGGLGKRLRSEVGETQKTMARIEGEPFLDLLLKFLKSQGTRRVILCTGFQAKQVEEYYQKNDQGLAILFSEEKEPLGTGGAIKNAQQYVQSDIFFALNGDCFCDLDYAQVLKDHQEKDAKTTLVVSRSDNKNDFGSIVIDDQGKIVRFVEKMGEGAPEPGDLGGDLYVSNGIYCFDRDVFVMMPPQDKFSIEYDFFHHLPSVMGEAFRGFVSPNRFIDIGVPERYREAQEALKKYL